MSGHRQSVVLGDDYRALFLRVSEAYSDITIARAQEIKGFIESVWQTINNQNDASLFMIADNRIPFLLSKALEMEAQIGLLPEDEAGDLVKFFGEQRAASCLCEALLTSDKVGFIGTWLSDFANRTIKVPGCCCGLSDMKVKDYIADFIGNMCYPHKTTEVLRAMQQAAQVKDKKILKDPLPLANFFNDKKGVPQKKYIRKITNAIKKVRQEQEKMAVQPEKQPLLKDARWQANPMFQQYTQGQKRRSAMAGEFKR